MIIIIWASLNRRLMKLFLILCIFLDSFSNSIESGVGFISLQVLAYNGIIQVNHSVIEEKLEAMLDLNRDGRVCRDDGALLADRVLNILQHNLPSAGGFVAGFMGGINFG